eukprot:5668493-Alexandrium_andersonii.AAC.1
MATFTASQGVAFASSSSDSESGWSRRVSGGPRTAPSGPRGFTLRARERAQTQATRARPRIQAKRTVLQLGVLA